ncbi:MAG: class I SAM-dependent methyltransferase [Gammaproteobacteria bacterium]|nr:class I SAM-dependent methyltransferase [Gammaproteobacteria bacterium]
MPDRKAHWESIYRDKSSADVSWYQLKPGLSLELIHKSQVAHDEPVMDVGGGASKLVDHLVDEGYSKLAVLDISATALATTRQRLGKKALQVEWFEQDLVTFNPEHSFSLWHDRAVFHFLTNKADREKYIKVLRRALSKNAQFIIAAFAIGGPEKCSGLDIVQYDAEKLQAELGDDFELLEQKSEVHMTPSNKKQEFTYFRFKKRQESVGLRGS